MSFTSQSRNSDCATFGQFVQRVSMMTTNTDSVTFETVTRTRREACVFILEQRDSYAPPALSTSALAKIWTQLGCSIDISRSVDPEKAKRAAKAAINLASSTTKDSKNKNKNSSSMAHNAHPVQTLESTVTSIEWAMTTVSGKKLNAGGCYVNALEMDSKCNAAAWFNLGCWLSTETKEHVKGNARVLAMVKAEEEEERNANVAIGGRNNTNAGRRSANRHGIPKGAALPGARISGNPTGPANPASPSQSPSTSTSAVPTQAHIALPSATIGRKLYTATLCFSQSVTIDTQLQGGWLNMGAALALEQLLEKRGALPTNRPSLLMEAIEGPTSKRAGEAVSRQFCYKRELESRKAAPAQVSAVVTESEFGPTDSVTSVAFGGASQIIAPSVLSSPHYLSNHPDAITNVTFTDSAPSSDDENAHTARIRHERRVNRYRSLAITADARGPSRATVRGIAWVNLAATLENLTSTVTVTVSNFFIPYSHAQHANLYVKPEETMKVTFNKRQCLECAIAEDPTITKAWINLGTIMTEEEHILFAPNPSDRDHTQHMGRLQCYVKAMEVSEDSNPALWLSIATSLFEDVKRDSKVSREYCMRLPLKSRRKVAGVSGNVSVHAQRKAVIAERERRRLAKAAAELAAAEAEAAAARAAAEEGATPLTLGALEVHNNANPNTQLSPKRHTNKNIFSYDEEEDESVIPAVVATTFDCVDCMEEYLTRCPDDSKGWLLAAHMFQYFIEGQGMLEPDAADPPPREPGSPDTAPSVPNASSLVVSPTEAPAQPTAHDLIAAPVHGIPNPSLEHPANPATKPAVIPCIMVVGGYRYTTPREVFADVVRCDPNNGEVWFTLGNYLYYDPKNKDGTMVIRIGRSRRAEQMNYKDCYSKAQSLGAMSRFTCCAVM